MSVTRYRIDCVDSDSWFVSRKRWFGSWLIISHRFLSEAKAVMAMDEIRQGKNFSIDCEDGKYFLFDVRTGEVKTHDLTWEAAIVMCAYYNDKLRSL